MKHLLTTGDGGKNEVLCERTELRDSVRTIPRTPLTDRLPQFILQMMDVPENFLVLGVVF